MHIAVLSDLHGNRVALDAVRDDMPAVDGVVCAGDVVGYNPWPGECVDAVRDMPAPPGTDGDGAATVMGNHDRAVATESSFRFNSMAGAGVEYARDHLDDDQLAWLAGLPTTRTACDGHVKLVHGHPDDPDRYTYPDQFAGDLLGDESLLVLGHTHVQAAEAFEDGVVLNPGSVGQPRDRDPRAAYAIVELDGHGVVDWELHRVEYDVGAVQAAIADAGLPEDIGKRLEKGR